MRRLVFLYVFGQDELSRLMYEMFKHRKKVYAHHAAHKALGERIALLQEDHAVSHSALSDAKDQHFANRAALEKAYTLDELN